MSNQTFGVKTNGAVSKNTVRTVQIKKEEPVQNQQNLPVFLGIDTQKPEGALDKFQDVVKLAFQIIEEELGTQNDYGKQRDAILKQAFQGAKSGSWKLPNTYHVTQLFIGGNKNKLTSPIYQNYKEGLEVEIEVRGVIYVPNRLMTAIIKTKADVENEFPHQTMVLSKTWTPVLSNTVLMQTCRGNRVFKDFYQEMMSNKLLKESQLQFSSELHI